MTTVKQYDTIEDFEKGINKQRGLGWLLQDWKAIVLNQKIVIIAIFRGRG